MTVKVSTIQEPQLWRPFLIATGSPATWARRQIGDLLPSHPFANLIGNEVGQKVEWKKPTTGRRPLPNWTRLIPLCKSAASGKADMQMSKLFPLWLSSAAIPPRCNKLGDVYKVGRQMARCTVDKSILWQR